MKKCIRCENEISDKVKFCPFCGTEQIKVENAKEIKARFCTECGRAWKVEENFCPVCGKQYKADPMSADIEEKKQYKEDTKEIKSEKSEVSQNEGEYENAITNSKLLKIWGIIFGIINVCNCLMNLQYLGYYATSDKIWGLGMVLACAWCSLICFTLAFRCKKEYGMTLFYALSCGEVFKSVLTGVQIHGIIEYQYWNLSAITYSPLVGAVCAMLIIYYIMKREQVLIKPAGWKMFDYIKHIPTVLQNIWLKKEATVVSGQVAVENKVELQKKEMTIPGTEADKILLVINTGIFLVFGTLYTIDLIYGIFASFSFLKIATNFFSILTCIAIWQIYSSGKKGELSSSGFSIISVLTWITAVVHIIMGVLLLIIGGSAGIEAVLIILLVMAIDIGYWCSLGNTLSTLKVNAKRGYKKLKVGIYPIVVLGIKALIKAAMFAWASFLQSTANSINGELNQYGSAASSIVGELFGEVGLGYETGYSWSSSGIQSLLNPITSWVQKTLGFSQNPLIMIIAIVIPVLEMILLIKLRSYGRYRWEES